MTQLMLMNRLLLKLSLTRRCLVTIGHLLSVSSGDDDVDVQEVVGSETPELEPEQPL